MLHTYRRSHITFLRSSRLEQISRVVHAFSTRRGETRDLTFDRNATEARDQLASAARMAGWPVCGLVQVHSSRVHAVTDDDFANRSEEGDAAFTHLPGLALAIVTADCVPILVAEREGRAVAAIHAGWRGTSEGVAPRAVEAMVRERAVDPEHLVVSIGPHIGACCMEVGEEVYELFRDPAIFERRPGRPRPHLNLGEANRKQLVATGIPRECIEVSGLCTRCRPDLFHSYRRDGEASGRMVSLIGIEAG